MQPDDFQSLAATHPCGDGRVQMGRPPTDSEEPVLNTETGQTNLSFNPRPGLDSQGLGPGFESDGLDLEDLLPGRDIIETKMTRRIGHRSPSRAEKDHVSVGDRLESPPPEHAAL